MPVDRLEPRRLFASGLFAPPQVYGDYEVAELLATGDFDGNGTVDVVGTGAIRAVGPPYDGFLYALLNNGAGGFTDVFSHGNPRAAGVPARVLAAHLDEDAFEDVVVSGFIPGTNEHRLAVYFSRGDGRFEQSFSDSPLSIPVTASSTFTAADFNNDGRRELAVDGTILYRSGGAFAPVDTGGRIVGFSIDLNGDGWTDSFDAGRVRLNDGAGSLLPPTPYAGGGFAGWPAGRGHGGGSLTGPGGRGPADAGDFNGDGTLDVVGGTRTADTSLGITLHDGAGGFRAGLGLNFYSRQSIPVAADVDGDGLDDLAVGTDDGVVVLLSRGDGTFRPAGSESATGGPVGFDMVAADFNNDGRDDLAAVGANGIEVYVAGGGTAPAPVAAFGATPSGNVPRVTVVVPWAEGGQAREVTFTLKGPGAAWAYDWGRGTGLSLVLDGTTAASSLTITTPPISGVMLTGLQVNGSLRSVTGASTALFGDLAVAGTLKSLTLLGTTGGTRVTIGGAGVPTAINVTNAADLTVTTQSPISRLIATRWRDDDVLDDVVTAPSIGSILFRPSRLFSFPVECYADFNVTGGGTSLKLLDVRGELVRSVVRTAGSIGSVRAVSLVDSTVFAGVAPGVTDLPASRAEFAAQATIGSLRVSPGISFPVASGIRVAAWSIGRFQVMSVGPGRFSPDAPTGLAATSVGSYFRGSAAAGVSPVRKSRVTTPGSFDTEGLYVARIV